MRPLSQFVFETYALSLPRGFAFGRKPPIGAWESDDSISCGIIRCDDETKMFEVIILRRRVDNVWTAIPLKKHSLKSKKSAIDFMFPFLKAGIPKEPIPPGEAHRPALWAISPKNQPSNIFNLFLRPSHQMAGWLLNQVYLAMPNPDKNWASDCQTKNFHTRLWEAYLLACFREQGLLVTQEFDSPDFHISNQGGDEAWVEAVTANSPNTYDHVNANPVAPPEEKRELFIGQYAVRFSKTIRSKLQKGYHHLKHVRGKSFVIALADFHAPGSMTWSREALPCYLYGFFPEVIEWGAKKIAVPNKVETLIGKDSIPAGIFMSEEYSEISAVIFSNAATIAKFNRVGISAGTKIEGLKFVRYGIFWDKTPGALKPHNFSMDISSSEYRSLWPQYYEPWSAELEVFHNPLAKYPLKNSFLPEANHWRWSDGEGYCDSYYDTFILSSKTLILKSTDPTPAVEDFINPKSL